MISPEAPRAVVAVQDEHGRVVYEYGWLGIDGANFEWSEERHRAPSWTTTVSWAERPRRSYRYPTDADFARPLEPRVRQLDPARPELRP